MRIIVVILLALFLQSTSFAGFREPEYPEAVHKLIINTDKIDSYQRLLHKIGFEIDERYSYSAWNDICRANKVGIAGNYKFLKQSTGGDNYNENDYQKFNRVPCGWKMFFYKNHNMTVIHEVCRDPDKQHLWVRMLKAGRGKLSNLNLER